MEQKEKEQVELAIAYLQTCSQKNEKTQNVFSFALNAGIETSHIATTKDRQFPLSVYIMHTFCNACDVLGRIVSNENIDELTDSLFVVSLLSAIAETSKSCWSYGAELLYDLDSASIMLSRKEIMAILAQNGTYATNRSKGDQMEGNMIAVCLYCGRLMALYNTLVEREKPFTIPDSVTQDKLVMSISDICTMDAPYQQRVETLVREYFPMIIPNDKQSSIDVMLNYLANNSDFYYAPASTRYHLSEQFGLVTHTLHVTDRLVQLTAPLMPEQVAECVMSSIGHDFCKIGVYAPYTKNKKVYHDGGSKRDLLGAFDWQEGLEFSFSDSYPIGHGLKSMHQMSRFLPGLPRRVASAIDAHMLDSDTNPRVYEEIEQFPLGLWLHMADMIATCIDEV